MTESKLLTLSDQFKLLFQMDPNKRDRSQDDLPDPEKRLRMTLERIGDTYSPRGAGGRREERGAKRENTPPHWGGRRGDTPPSRDWKRADTPPRRDWKRADTPPKREASPPGRRWADDSPSPPRSWRGREGQSSPGPARRRSSPRNWRDRRGDTPPRYHPVPRGKVYFWCYTDI